MEFVSFAQENRGKDRNVHTWCSFSWLLGCDLSLMKIFSTIECDGLHPYQSTICREPPTHLWPLPVRHFVGIARFFSIPTCTFSVAKIGTVGSSCARSELVRDDGWRKRACLVPERRRWLCSYCGIVGTACWERQLEQDKQLVARHSLLYQGVSITLAKMQGKWAFNTSTGISPVLTVVQWFWSVIICWHANDYGH